MTPPRRCVDRTVESLLRAFRWSEDTSFEGQHDLTVLLKASRLLIFNDDYIHARGAFETTILESRLRLRGALNEVVALWHSTEKARSEFSRARGESQYVLSAPFVAIVESA